MAYLTIIFAFTFIILINITINEEECEKETPIKTISSDDCLNTYCDETQFESGECTIVNSIAQKQWLYNINILEDFVKMFVIEMPNKDIILVPFKASSYVDPEDPEWEYECYYPLFYKIESSGELSLLGEFPDIIIETQYINLVGIKNGDNYYPLICDTYNCYLFDWENDFYQQISLSQLFQMSGNEYKPFTNMYLTYLNINNENNILFTSLIRDASLNNIYNIFLTKIDMLTNANDFSEFDVKYRLNDLESNSQRISNLKCLMTTNKIIECLYIKQDTDYAYYVGIYDESLNNLENIFFRTVIYQHPFYVPIHVIHLKNEIAAYAYYIDYTSNVSSSLYIQVNELINTDSTYSFNNIITERSVAFDDFSNFEQLSRVYQEDMIKITDNIFAYLMLNPDNVIILILFDIYNNYQNIFVRYYKIDLTLYNIESIFQIKMFNFNTFLGLAFIGELYGSNSFYIVFGCSKKNIDKMLLDTHKSAQGLVLELNNYYSKIDNNLFGYDLDIKISSVSSGLEGIKLFSVNENREININEPIDREDTIIFDFSNKNVEIGEVNIIEVTSTIKAPIYEEFTKLYDKYDPPDVDYSGYYESRIVEEKIFTIEIKFGCYESITASTVSYLKTKKYQIDSNLIIILSNYIYSEEHNTLLSAYLSYLNDIWSKDIIYIDEYIYNNSCINECPSNFYADSSKNCVPSPSLCENQYKFNSQCYNSCPEGTISYISETNDKMCKCKNLYYKDQNNNIKCLSSSICDDNHPVLDESTKECRNYRVQYESNYYYECPENKCISESSTSSNKTCEEKTPDMRVFNGICFNNFPSVLNNLETMARDKIRIDNIGGIVLSVYSFEDYNKNFDKVLQNDIDTTMIDLRECLSLYKKSNNIGEEIDIYIVIADTPNFYSNETINRFDFELYFENLTKINNLDECKDMKMTIYSPITNPEIINLELGEYFYSEGGYNIFNKNDKFYKDICSGADMDGNDITLNDRYIDVYPHDIQICPDNCECLGINYTTNVLMCDCEIKLNNDDNTNEYEYELMDKDEILNYFKDFNNIVEYFGDMFNFKISKCFNLIYNINNYKYNTGFYIGAFSFVSSLTLLIIFKILGIHSIRVIFYKNLGNIIRDKRKILKNIDDERTKSKETQEEEKLIINEIRYKQKSKRKSCQSLRHKNDNYLSEKRHIKNPPKRKDFGKKKNRKRNSAITRFNVLNTLSNLKDEDSKKNKNDITIENISNNEKNITINNNKSHRSHITSHNKSFHKSQIEIQEEEDTKMSNSELNILSYFRAKEIDDRNIFTILFSIFFIKIELTNNIFYPDEYSSRLLLFNIYIVSLYMDLLMNCLLYNDYAVSQKYHCNGNLEFITSFIISTLSNIFSFVILYIIKYLTDYTAFMEVIINEIKKIKDYFTIIVKFMKVLKIKTYFLILLELLLGLFMVYYLFIFSTINSKSINSFLLNYLYSQIESLFYSFCISVFVAILRKISLSCHSKRLYLMSLYFNEHL